MDKDPAKEIYERLLYISTRIDALQREIYEEVTWCLHKINTLTDRDIGKELFDEEYGCDD